MLTIKEDNATIGAQIPDVKILSLLNHIEEFLNCFS